jgi:hypothetical protein
MRLRAIALAAICSSIAAAPPAVSEASGIGEVRAPKPDARRLLADARGESAIVRDLLTRIADTDVIAFVQLDRTRSIPRGATALLTAVADRRYLVVNINPDHDRATLIAVLGHELQHVLEVARSPHVRDEVAFRRLFQRIGQDPGAVDHFETDQADLVGRQIWMEVASKARS